MQSKPGFYKQKIQSRHLFWEAAAASRTLYRHKACLSVQWMLEATRALH